MEKTYKIVHKLPGRVRVRLRAIQQNTAMAAGLEELLVRQTGVRTARVNPDCASLTISFRPDEFDPIAWLEQLHLDEVARVKRKTKHKIGARAKLPAPLNTLHRATFAFGERVPANVQFFLGAASLVATLLDLPVVITGSILSLSMLPILNRALLTLLDEGRIGADLLDSASCALLIREGSYLPASVMTCLIGLGEFIRYLVYERCQKLIDYQVALSERSAWLAIDNRRVRVPVSKLNPGDRLVVYHGELIAFAGIIEQGEGTIVPTDPEADFAPQLVREGDCVNPNMLLIDGKLYVRNQKYWPPEQIDPIMEKNKRRRLQKTRLQKVTQKTGYHMVGPVLLLSSILFAATRNIHQAMAIITFDFITGSRLAIPTALLSSMYKAGSMGILMRNAESLEKLAEVDVIIFARSGCLTARKPSVTEIFACPSYTIENVARLAAAVEQRYSAEAAFAIYSYTNIHTIPVPERSRSKVFSGLGVSGEVEGHSILAGNTRLMRIAEIDLLPAHDFLEKCKNLGASRTCVAIDGKLAGVIAHQDRLRADAPHVVATLKRMGLSEVAMTTGGSQDIAEAIAAKAGIAKIHYRTLPEDQGAIVKAYKELGHKVAFVGHDADDMLALEAADVAITLSTGAEVARYRADIVLTADDLSGLVEAVKIARSGMALARQNLVMVSIPNLLGLALSLTDQTSMLKATLLNNGSVLVGTINGLRPLLEQNKQSCL